MSHTDLKNKVALITGAGGGLGRSHALHLAKLGAKIIVNDPGVSVNGIGQNASAADETVRLIRDLGYDAIAEYSGVETMAGAASMVSSAIKNFGRLDIVVNNAGILRDGSFKKQDDESWQKIIDIHLTGSRHVTKAAWEAMTSQNYGRVIFTLSASGLYGNFGQSNYAAAKMGLWGLMRSLKEEGAKYNILANAIAPVAQSRMTENLMPPEMLEKLKPAFISPLVAFLSSDLCTFSGQCFTVAAGKISKVILSETETIKFETPEDMSLEKISAELTNLSNKGSLLPSENLLEATARLIGS